MTQESAALSGTATPAAGMRDPRRRASQAGRLHRLVRFWMRWAAIEPAPTLMFTPRV
jgi:hypothetical protein